MRISPQKFASIVVSPQRISLGQGVSIEWKLVPDALTPTGITASYEEIDGVPCYRIKTSEEKDWVRLHLDVSEMSAKILGARFLVRVLRGPETPVIKPYLVQTHRRNGSRTVPQGTSAVRMKLQRDQWFNVFGSYLCNELSSSHKFDLVLDLPKNAEILIADIAYDWFIGAIDDALSARMTTKGAVSLCGFEAWQVKDIDTWLSCPPVYAVSAVLQDTLLSGWALTASPELYVAVGGSTLTVPIMTKQSPIIEPGVCLPTSFCIALPLGENISAPVRLITSPEALEPIWVGRLDQRLTPQRDSSHVFAIDTARIENYRLYLEGDVVHPQYPGMPVRLDLMLGTQRIHSLIARSPAQSSRQFGAHQAFQFKIDVPLQERQIGMPLFIRFVDAPDFAPAFVRTNIVAPPLVASSPDVIEEVTVPEGSAVVGNVEGRTAMAVEGWALCPEAPDAQIELVLLMNDEPVAYTKTRRYRKDVQEIYGGAGYCGFTFELPPNMCVIENHVFEIRSINGESRIRKNRFDNIPPVGKNEIATLPARRSFLPGPIVTTGRRISVIVLNRNGSELLREMFESCVSEDLSDEIEWIVVDHNSQDNSEEVCEKFVQNGADIRFFRRLGNYSFSESNNFGVQQATGDLLIFANNDLIFPHAFGDLVREYMTDSTIGMLGVRLLDHVDDEAQQSLEIDQHLGVFFQKSLSRENWIRPYETRKSHEIETASDLRRTVAVTGAFCVMRRSEFDSIGGFDEDYSYGLEDVDLCLKVRFQLGKEIVCASDISIIHHRGYSRQQDTHSGIRRRNNNDIFNQRWGAQIRRRIKETAVQDPAVWTGSRPVFAFVVADVGDATSAGEFYTSLEMGRALQRKIPCHVRYIPESDWYDLSDVDVLVAMVNRFDINKIKKASPWLITVNWMRQWFDRWAEDATVSSYDHLFASSRIASEFLEAHLGRKVDTMPIASEYTAFAQAKPNPEFACDYCFTGSRFGPPREIEFQLDPTQIKGIGKVFGYNWEDTPFQGISAGPVPYSMIPQVYASTKVVIDDANIATKLWGSCNSRVFDAMASGALLISNGAAGVGDLFGDAVPTFDSQESLTETLNYWLSHEDERQARVAQLQEIIDTGHRYDARADQLLAAVTGKQPIRIAIKCAAIYSQRQQWGDYHYAESLAVALRKLGYVVRVDCRESWYSGISASDDVVIVLRGLVEYKLRLNQKNIFWMISHPNEVSIAEMEGYDQVYIASRPHAETVKRLVRSPVSFMPQCTDIGRFRFDPKLVNTHPQRNLYVANSRGVFRSPVRWSIQRELPLDIYGVGWEPFIQDSRFKGQLIPNEVLGEIYASSRLVICDHWADMSNLGYVANRVFDVLASGGRLLVDNVEGLGELVPSEFYSVFRDEQSFVDLIKADVGIDLDLRRKAAHWTAEYHSFDARARVFAERIEELMDTPALTGM